MQNDLVYIPVCILHTPYNKCLFIFVFVSNFFFQYLSIIILMFICFIYNYNTVVKELFKSTLSQKLTINLSILSYINSYPYANIYKMQISIIYLTKLLFYYALCAYIFIYFLFTPTRAVIALTFSAFFS